MIFCTSCLILASTEKEHNIHVICKNVPEIIFHWYPQTSMKFLLSNCWKRLKVLFNHFRSSTRHLSSTKILLNHFAKSKSLTRSPNLFKKSSKRTLREFFILKKKYFIFLLISQCKKVHQRTKIENEWLKLLITCCYRFLTLYKQSNSWITSLIDFRGGRAKIYLAYKEMSVLFDVRLRMLRGT